mgnify:CR=1 FL=1
MPGTREYLTCEQGEIQLAVAGEQWRLTAGDVVVFRGDQRHSYRNPGEAGRRSATRSCCWYRSADGGRHLGPPAGLARHWPLVGLVAGVKVLVTRARRAQLLMPWNQSIPDVYAFFDIWNRWDSLNLPPHRPSTATRRRAT